MTIPKRPQNTINDMIQALKLCVDDDGYLELDRDQTTQFFFFLYELLERQVDHGDAISVRAVIEDLCGVLPDKQEESA